MANYVISDIHGALDVLNALMQKAGIDLAGGDRLWLLGDYVDWNRQSMETLLYVMDLTEGPYKDRVTCLIGNHEEMFLHTIHEYQEAPEEDKDKILSASMANWVQRNAGIVTWLSFLKMSEQEQERVRLWLEALPLSAEVQLEDGRLYLLGHAYPYFYDMDHFPENAAAEREDTVWRRLLLHEDPFAEYRGDKKYTAFICGHTITNNYYREVRGDNTWKGRKPIFRLRNTIFRAEKFIDIDCGAKLFLLKGHENNNARAEAARAQLACLRLEDMKVFYAR